MACGGVKPWSFPACVTAPWRLACACPRASLSPRSPATGRDRCRLSGFTGRVGPPAVSGRREPGIDGLAQRQQVSRHWSLHTTLRNQPSPKARRTLPPLGAVWCGASDSAECAHAGVFCVGCQLARSASAVRTLPLVSLRARRPGRLVGELSRCAAAPCPGWDGCRRRSCEAEETYLGGVGDQAPLVVAVRTEVPERHLRRGVPLSCMAGQIVGEDPLRAARAEQVEGEIDART